MLPRIEAGEALAAIERAALCHNVGFEREVDRQQAVDALRAKATGEDRFAQPVPADAADLAAIGIAIVRADPADAAGGEGHG